MKTVVCTPTRNRRWAWIWSHTCMESQNLKPDLWIVLDNSDVPEQDWSVSSSCPYVQYHHDPVRRTIATLRNRCLDLALAEGADYIVFWDDDDYYPPTRISGGVKALEDNPKADLAGSSKMFLLLTRENLLLTTGPFHEGHATAATWTVRRRYAEKHRFDPSKAKGEEITFTKNWTAEMTQVPPEECIVVMGHSHNTVDKSDVGKRPQVYNATIVNSDNGKMMFRMKWPVPWDLWKTTFSV